MPSEITAVRSYFTKLGLQAEIADLYLALYTYGPQTISELSRSSGVERTRIYRLINQLTESSLIEIESHYKRGIIKAAPLANLNITISKKEQELKSLQDELGLVEQLLTKKSISHSATRIQFYDGIEGAKQIYWNQTRAKGELLAILHEGLQPVIGEKFFNRWVDRINENDIVARGLGGQNFLKTLATWRSTHHQPDRIHNWTQRTLPESVLPIRHNTVIYDDVVCYCNWSKGEVFSIEIYNVDIANAQRKFFELLWEQGTDELKH